MPETFGDGNESRSFGLVIERIVGVRAVDDLTQQYQRRIPRELVFFQDRLERALLAVMAQLDILDVVGNRVEAFRLVHDFLGRHEEELRALVDKFLDEPWAGD